mmetsp:Transcript_49214/g.92280  ORF Transcript_49214/g.92280 Transcript_49214/m.92280 type:complete len:208 (+) Transcript_49214:268-891(+)
MRCCMTQRSENPTTSSAKRACRAGPEGPAEVSRFSTRTKSSRPSSAAMTPSPCFSAGMATTTCQACSAERVVCPAGRASFSGTAACLAAWAEWVACREWGGWISAASLEDFPWAQWVAWAAWRAKAPARAGRPRPHGPCRQIPQLSSMAWRKPRSTTPNQGKSLVGMTAKAGMRSKWIRARQPCLSSRKISRRPARSRLSELSRNPS